MKNVIGLFKKLVNTTGFLNKQSTNIRKKDSARFGFILHPTYTTFRLLKRDVSHVIQ